MRPFFFFVCLFCLVGCEDQNSPEVVEANKLALSQEGFLIGTLPDGREVRQYRIDRGQSDDHFIYVVKDGDSVTTNRSESRGKTSVNRTEVFINGKKYKVLPYEESDPDR